MNVYSTLYPLPCPMEFKDSFSPPERRRCNFSPRDSLENRKRAIEAIFITDEEICDKSPMKSKFHPNVCITEDGKHVVLQPSIKSAEVSCMAMLLLDNGMKVEIDTLETIDSAETMAYKLNIVYKISNLAHLPQYLNKNGPGIITVFQSSLQGHCFILDALSENYEATIRDPFHGWMITITSDAFKNLINGGGTFFQLV